MRPEQLPLRPLTVGELLDAAVGLARSAGAILIPLGLVIAVVEQLALTPLRIAYFGDAFPIPHVQELLSPSWLVVAVGAGTETAIITILGGVAGRAASHAVVGAPMRARDLLRASRTTLIVPVAILAGAVTFVLTLAAPGWLIGYPLLGLVAPTIAIDRLGLLRAIPRGLRMVLRSTGRAAAIRILGYAAWLALRIGFGLGLFAALDFLSGFALPFAGTWTVVAALAVVNGFAYPTLACLDAVLHIETRMRTEGLDIALARAAARAPLHTASLAVTR